MAGAISVRSGPTVWRLWWHCARKHWPRPHCSFDVNCIRKLIAVKGYGGFIVCAAEAARPVQAGLPTECSFELDSMCCEFRNCFTEYVMRIQIAAIIVLAGYLEY